MKFIDSDFIIASLRGQKAVAARFNEIKREESATTVINEFELLYGAKVTGKEEAVIEVNNALNMLTIFNFDRKAVEKAAEIQANLAKTGTQLDAKDLFIAAIVLLNNGTLVTRNVKHFERVQGLKIETW